MNIFISASSDRTDFIKTVEDLIDGEFKDRHKHEFIPWTPSVAGDPTLLAKIRNKILGSHLFLMDITPEEFTTGSGGTVWVSNSGVLIEYGIIAAYDWISMLCIYCDSRVNRNLVHPAIHKPIDQYSVDDLDSLKESLRAVIRNREQTLEQEAKRRELEQIPISTDVA